MDNQSRNTWTLFAALDFWGRRETPKRQTVSLPVKPQTKEEAQRRIQAAADRRAKRNAKHRGSDGR